jgi:hypothetical protein
MSRLVHIGSDGASMAVTMARTILVLIWRLLWLNPLLWPVLVAVHIALWASAASFAALVRTSKVAIRMYTINDANLLFAMRCGTERRTLQNSALRKARLHVVSFAKGYSVIPSATYCRETGRSSEAPLRTGTPRHSSSCMLYSIVEEDEADVCAAAQMICVPKLEYPLRRSSSSELSIWQTEDRMILPLWRTSLTHPKRMSTQWQWLL